LNLASAIDPLQYMKVISLEQSRNYPIWFLLRRMGDSKDEIKDELEHIKSRSSGYKSILERVDQDKIGINYKNHYSVKDSAPRASLRRNIYQRLLNSENIEYSDEEESRTLLEALTNLDIHDVEFDQVQHALSKIYNDCYPFKNDQYNYLFRNVLTLVDYLYFSEI